MRRLNTSILVFLIMIVFTSPVFTQDKPDPAAAKSVLDFYYYGQGKGVVLADVKICADVDQNECRDEVGLTSLRKGVQYHLWMLYIVPQGDEADNILVQFNQKGLTRFTRDVSVSGSIRYRTWKTFTLNQTGEWEIIVLHDRGDDIETLVTLPVSVVDQ